MTTPILAVDAERQRRLDNVVLSLAELAGDDDSPAAEQLHAQAEQIAARRRAEYAAAVAAGVVPCPAAWSRTTTCVHPSGDGHGGRCFSPTDGQGWARATSWFTPEAAEQARTSTWHTPAAPAAALTTPEEPMTMTTTDTSNRLTITAVRWRMLNRLGTVGATAVIRASELLASQDGTDEDLLWLGQNELVVATLIGRTTRLDLVEHLSHHGSSMVLAVRLNGRGRRTLEAWQNRVLRQLFAVNSRKMPLRTLLANAGVDASSIAILVRRRLLTVAVRATGEPLTADDVALLPAATLTAKLTDKGRTYLPV